MLGTREYANWPIKISSLVNGLSFLPVSLLGWFCLFVCLFICRNTFYIQDTIHLLVIYAANIFSNSVVCSFPLWFLFVKKVLNLNVVNLSIFSFISAFALCLINTSLSGGQEDILLYYFLKA